MSNRMHVSENEGFIALSGDYGDAGTEELWQMQDADAVLLIEDLKELLAVRRERAKAVLALPVPS